MKRLLPLLLCFVLWMTGCGNTTAAEPANSQADTLGTVEVLGKIKEINGNEILLALAEEASPSSGQGPTGNPDSEEPPLNGDSSQGERQGRERPSGGNRPNREQGDDTSQESGEGRQRERPQFDGDGETSGMPQRPETDGQNTQTQGEAGDQMPQGGGPGGGGNNQEGGGGPQGEERGGQSPGGGISITLTGEEKTYLIPVTAAITSGTGDAAKTIRFTQLAVKNVIRLHLDDAGTIVSVEVLQ